MCNFIASGWNQREREKGGEGRDAGPFIGGLGMRRGLGLGARGRSDGGEGVGLGQVSSRGRRGPWQLGPGHQRDRGRGMYPFGVLPGWALAASAAGPNVTPSAFSYFLIYFSFYFSVFSFLFLLFCNLDSNQIKQSPRLF
jgi:hypothetical protein